MVEGAQQPLRIMVVDDHPMWRDAVANDLADAGFEVVATAADGAEAVRRASATSPNVVLLDLQMPGLGGVAATEQIVSADPSIRILVLSASGEHEDVLDAVKAGATGYLVKSASRDELWRPSKAWPRATRCSVLDWLGWSWVSSVGSSPNQVPASLMCG